MAFCNEQGRRLLLLVVCVLPLLAAQHICHIDIDSSKGLWRDVTPNQAETDSDTYCEGYLYRETNLTCLGTQCSHKGIVNYTCTLYYNADTYWPCLATCKTKCHHGHQCPGGNTTCPCQRHSPRYSRKKMCVRFNKLTNCIGDPCNENGEKIPASCIKSCDNGWCDANGGCNCLSGFSKVSNTCTKINCPDKTSIAYCQNVCQMSGCLSYGKCLNGDCKCNEGFYKNDPKKKINQCAKINCPANGPQGYCQSFCLNSKCRPNGKCVNGVCQCNEGFYKNDPDNKIYQCARINCPASGPQSYCQSVCQNSGCLSNGKCEYGECKCNEGFYKNDPDNRIYQCAKINCPTNDKQGYCQNVCQNSGCLTNGGCVDGECKCNSGYKNYSNQYTCEPIRCPDAYESKHCKATCDAQCEHGRCSDDSGACTCEDGFKKTPEELYKCVKIKCPAQDIGDRAFCRITQCKTNCTNGECDGKGICQCEDGFVETTRARVDCHHKCNVDGTCPLATILSGIVGGGFAVMVAIIVTAAILVRARNKKEREQREQEEAQGIHMDTLNEEPEYANYNPNEEPEYANYSQGQEGDMEDNSMYHYQPPRRGVR